ncbi:MAG: branched-chain amino acid ABC transporter permease [Cyanobacteria bacterium QS_8_64_29]|nr:MAG: branched-chain amino acid ABC transporter permease [Cyanobacteria bacterium QS_8_64_29]
MELLQLAINGLAIGSTLAMAAMGLTLTFGVLRLPNFAHGDFLTLGAYVSWAANTGGASLWAAMPLGALGTVAAMLLAERLLWRPTRSARASAATLIITSIGLGLFVRSGVLLIWGGSNRSYDLPVMPALNAFGLDIAFFRVVAIALAGAAILGVHLLLQRTRMGKAMRAVADNIDLARISGIDVDRVVLWTWGLAGTLAAIGGTTYGLMTAVRPDMGWFLLLPIFAATIAGGIGNPYGAITGAFIIGMAQELSVPLLGSQYKLAAALVVMVLVLLLRPQGLFRGTL